MTYRYLALRRQADRAFKLYLRAVDAFYPGHPTVAEAYARYRAASEAAAKAKVAETHQAEVYAI